jgi:CBS domain-containing protein
MNVAAILKQKGREVFTTAPDTTLHDIAKLLGVHRIGCIVVTGSDGKVIGIVSDATSCARSHEPGPRC